MSENEIFLKNLYDKAHTHIYISHMHTYVTHIYVYIHIHTYAVQQSCIPQQQILQQRDILYDPINKTFCNLENYKKVAVERAQVPVAFKVLLGPCLLVKPVWVWYQDNFDDIKSTF